ncbi:hypothetical protein FGG08_006662 [Glutinoglossum americanum]|uniref:Uncharacterized protein n=1 Tax=Glutinoglossum americanum TaxID=1670608 RepID=A0A9P8I6X8_9PEZI|nr:hypothetical protein FGG08_006662 [Glutinoglossum americanum]
MANQQPDFAVAAQYVHQFGDQVALMGNTAIGGLAAVLEEIQRINQRFDRFEQSLKAELKAERVNNISRLQNSSVTHPDQHLAVLHSYVDNTPLPNFPATPADIPDLSNANLGVILRQLELSVAGDRLEKEGRLRVAIGLLERAV